MKDESIDEFIDEGVKTDSNITEIRGKTVDFRRKNKKNAGFTLIEVVAVTVILGIMATFVLPSVSGVGDKVRNVKSKSDVVAIEQAAELYKLEKGSYPENVEALIPDYLHENDSADKYVIVANGKKISVEVRGEEPIES